MQAKFTTQGRLEDASVVRGMRCYFAGNWELWNLELGRGEAVARSGKESTVREQRA